ncbi:MAG: carboxypeptidase-like regulatory domain-containing protein [Bacteroidota bacterium]|nr:carboxypeptidase-like regulatory domain-containing protein [Bacteroidota bacterium]
MKQAFLLIILLTLYSGTWAQNSIHEEKYLLKGIILNAENKETLPLVTVYNKGMQQGVTSNASGIFSINYQQGDSIVFQSMGFHQLVLMGNPDSLGLSSYTVEMSPKTYELKTVDVTAFRTAEDFKKHILAMDMPEEKLRIPGLEMIRSEPSGEGKMVISGPVSFLYDKLSRRAIDHRKFLSTKANYEKQQLLSIKYKEVIKKIINIEDPEELEEFIGYCKLEDAFIESANEYEMIVAVNKCYDEYKISKDN